MVTLTEGGTSGDDDSRKWRVGGVHGSLMEVAGRPGWWFFLLFIPFVNIVIWIIVSLDVATSFGKSVWWGLGLLVFGYIFYLILGFGSAQYVGPGGRQLP